MIFTGDAILRLCVAIILGGLIGYERQRDSKSAGLRTHILVALGACLSMIVSINLAIESKDVYGFTSADPGRIAAQVITGISFLGAGTIMANSKERIITGLTTAASVWVVAALGLVVGAGYMAIATIVTVMIYAVLDVLRYADRFFNKKAEIQYHLLLTIQNNKSQLKVMSEFFQKQHYVLSKFYCHPYKKGSERMHLEVVIATNKAVTWSSLMVQFLNIGGVYSIDKLPLVPNDTASTKPSTEALHDTKKVIAFTTKQG